MILKRYLFILIVMFSILFVPLLFSEEIEVIEFEQYTTGYGDDLPFCQIDISLIGQCRCMSEQAHAVLDQVFLEEQIQEFCDKGEKGFAHICTAFRKSTLDSNQTFTYEGLSIKDYVSRLRGG